MLGSVNVPISVVMAVLLVITVSAFLVEFVSGEVSPSSGYSAPVQSGECKSSSDCQMGVCASIGDEPSACVCFSDEQCGTSYACIDNVCQRVTQ
jgi:hypothetical protein